MTTLIQSDDVWLLWTVILAGVAASIWLEQTFSWAAKISGPVLALTIALVLANLRIMPPQSAVYDVVQDSLVPLALPLLLFRANVFHIVSSTGWLFVAFHLASVGTVVGAVVAAAVLHRSVDDAPQVAAVMTASYIGGGVNFVAVARSYEMSENTTGPLLVADNFIMAGAFVLLLVICQSRWARRWYPHPHTVDAVDSRQLAAEHWRRKEISLLDIAAALAVAVTVVTVAGATAGLVRSVLGDSPLAQLAANRFVHITAWSTLVATLFHKVLARISGAEELGAYLLYVFLFVIGLPADLWQVITNVPLIVRVLPDHRRGQYRDRVRGRLVAAAELGTYRAGDQRFARRSAHGGRHGHLAGLVEAGAAGPAGGNLGLHDRHGRRSGRRRIAAGLAVMRSGLPIAARMVTSAAALGDRPTASS